MSHDHPHDHSHHHDNDHDHAHTHEHTHEQPLSDINKLKKLLPYLINHNREHAEELKTWGGLVAQSGSTLVAQELQQAADLSAKVVEHLARARENLGA